MRSAPAQVHRLANPERSRFNSLRLRHDPQCLVWAEMAALLKDERCRRSRAFKLFLSDLIRKPVGYGLHFIPGFVQLALPLGPGVFASALEL
jgi:hypothetical protein